MMVGNITLVKELYLQSIQTVTERNDQHYQPLSTATTTIIQIENFITFCKSILQNRKVLIHFIEWILWRLTETQRYRLARRRGF